MKTMRISVVLIALLVGGWLVYDGTHALATGDYVTRERGPGARQLGPWAQVVSEIGIEPRSTGMKCWHVFLGSLWLVSVVMFLTKPPMGRRILASCAVLSLWYLPVGTVLSILELVLLSLCRGTKEA